MEVNRTWMMYGVSYLHFLIVLFVNWMLDLSRHERIRVLLEDTQTGTRAKVYPLAAINGAGIILRVFEFAAACSFEFKRWADGGSSQISIILFIGMIF